VKNAAKRDHQASREQHPQALPDEAHDRIEGTAAASAGRTLAGTLPW